MGIPIETDRDIQQRYNFACTLPKGAGGAATELMIAYGTVVGKGTTFIFSGGLAGKTFIITDSKATTPGTKTFTFLRSMFANGDQPTGAEIVAALNAFFAADATPTVAALGAKGNLVITQAGAAAANGVLTIGPGTANELLGFPEDGVSLVIANGTGVSLILPSTFDNPFLLTRQPVLRAADLTPATLAKVNSLNIGWSWVPATRTLLITDITPTTGVQRAVAFSAEI